MFQPFTRHWQNNSNDYNDLKIYVLIDIVQYITNWRKRVYRHDFQNHLIEYEYLKALNKSIRKDNLNAGSASEEINYMYVILRFIFN